MWAILAVVVLLPSVLVRAFVKDVVPGTVCFLTTVYHGAIMFTPWDPGLPVAAALVVAFLATVSTAAMLMHLPSYLFGEEHAGQPGKGSLLLAMAVATWINSVFVEVFIASYRNGMGS